MINYGVTGRMLNDNWEIIHLVLDVNVLLHPHDYICITKYIKSVLDDYHIINKVLCMATDNAPNMIKAAHKLKSDLSESDLFV